MKTNSSLRLLSLLLACIFFLSTFSISAEEATATPSYIRWIDFDATEEAMRDCIEADEEVHANNQPLSWIDLLAALAQQYGGDFSHYKKRDLLAYIEKSKDTPLSEVVRNGKLYRYYQEAYQAVLGGLVGPYTEERIDDNGQVTTQQKYGLKCYHPLAAGYHFSHSSDFGNARTYGYKRRHLGHDMFGSVGTPVVAIESGYVEALGWNQYGGWRIGIRSFDGLRYYYYAHLRKDHPYVEDLYEGKIVCAGEIVGYLGMTGYSTKENVNHIKTPHLHVGLQIIFDKCQKDGVNQIWIDLYHLTNLLETNRVRAYPNGKDSISHIKTIDENMPD